MSPKVLKPRRGKAPPVEFSQPEYYFEDGLRKVRPYTQTYLAHAKQRWVSRTVPEVFASEMPRRCTENMIIEAMKRGDILVNDAVVSPDYILKGGESLCSLNCHRHEPPIPDTPIHVLEQTKDYVVFDKPHGITVHPNELNFHNTALEILRRDHDIPTYMHDAVTSGVVIFANVADPTVRERFQPPNVDSAAGSDSLVQKEYVCRVVGEFPIDPIVVREPILQSAGKVRVDSTGKPSETRFVRKWYDPASNTSLVSCYLTTGRQHQIRLHVAHLQHPIVNDRLYNPDYMKDWAPMNSSLTVNGETRFYPADIPPEKQPYMPYYLNPETPCHKCKEELEGSNTPNPSNMKIWLRAIRYQGPDWKFEVDTPDWADPRIIE
ncbi:RNA pseudouridylate synthase domain containing protein 2 [Gamsiella multidivaricata]|nr:RNA pseudouridylate synthase domain containing protein 2 [Gamsiella multidivaricata]